MTELLSPAGSPEALVAAVQSGADAVYLGLGQFNARHSARNFSEADFAGAVAYCHLRGVKVYLTLNTLLTDRELPQAEALLRLASDLGVDAVLIQDWGVLALAREVVPDLPRHASTQMSIFTLGGANLAHTLGMERVVLARELSREDIAAICSACAAEVEVFAHGALCMCYSGQCAMSALIGQRSGNRGRCAQPCRLPYAVEGGKMGHPLSLKDNNLSPYLGELADLGVACLKLEGRMKRPEYVAVVTAIYRRLLDEGRRPTAEESAQLRAAFHRDGFTDGYYRGKKGPAMFGVRQEKDRWPEDLFAQARAVYTAQPRRVAVTMAAALRAGEPSTLTVGTRREGRPVALTVTGATPEAARNRALTPQDLEARLGKTGGTVFTPRHVEATVDQGLMLSAAAVNDLRRRALGALAEKLSAAPIRDNTPRRTADPSPLPEGDAAAEAPVFTCSIARPDQLTDELIDLGPEAVYIPLELLDKLNLSPYVGRTKLFATLPRIFRTADEAPFRALLTAHGELTGAVLGNLGHFPITEGLDLERRGDFGLNVFNSRALALLQGLGLQSATVSFELRHQQIRDLHKALPCEAIVYGRLPLMVTENCPAANAGCCTHGQGTATLTDRTGADFPMLCAYGCRCEIENSQVLFLADKDDYRRCGLRYARLRFTTETPAQCAEILRRYLGQSDWAPESFTRGLFYRGVE